jgi:hypothetical protein
MATRSGIWELFNDFYDSHRILEQPFSQINCLFFHLFPFNPPAADPPLEDSIFALPAMPLNRYEANLTIRLGISTTY